MAEKQKYEAIYASIPESLKGPYLEQAMKVLSELKIQDMTLVQTDKVALSGISSGKTPKGGYRFTFARTSGGIAGYQSTNGGGHKDEEPPAYSPPFRQEEVLIIAGEEGIMAFSWMGCAKVIETLSENVELMPFAQIQEKVKNQIYYKKSFSLGNRPSISISVRVTAAELRMGYIGVKDHPGQALMVPVWVFHAQETYSIPINPAKPEEGMKTMQGNRDYFIINAMDGGVIEEVYDFPEE